MEERVWWPMQSHSMFSTVPASVFGGHQWSMADSAISELISHFCWWRLPALIWDLLFHSSVPLPCRFNLPLAPAGFATCPVGLAGLTPTLETVSLCCWPAHGSYHTQAWLVPWTPSLLDGDQKQPVLSPHSLFRTHFSLCISFSHFSKPEQVSQFTLNPSIIKIFPVYSTTKSIISGLS